MKTAKKLISMLLVCIMLLGTIAEIPMEVAAGFTFSIVDVDYISLQIPVPLAGHSVDTGIHRIKKTLRYDYEDVKNSKYEIKSLKWFEKGGDSAIDTLGYASEYDAEICIRTTGDGFWSYPSNMSCYVNGIKATFRSNKNNNELTIRVTLQTAIKSGEAEIEAVYVNGVYNRNKLPAYVDCDYSARLIFPEAMKEAGYTVLVDYTEYYYKKGESKAYTTYTKTYDLEDLKYTNTISATYYELETDGIGDIPGRSANIVVDYFIVPPSGKGAKTLVQRHIHGVEFLYEDYHESMNISGASVGDQVKHSYDEDDSSDKITVDPYFQEPFTIWWSAPANQKLNTGGGKNGAYKGDVQYKLRVYVDGEEIKNPETEVYSTSYVPNMNYTSKLYKTHLNNVIGGDPGDEVKIRAEIYVRYLDGGADDGTIETAPVKTFNWTVKYSDEIENDHSNYIEAVYAEGILVEKGDEGYKATVQAYLPQDIEFQFEWLSSNHFYDETTDHTIRAFVFQSPTLDSATDLYDPTLGANYVELEKDSDYLLGGNTYRYPITVFGKPGDSGELILQLWFCDEDTGELIKKIDSRRIVLTFADRKDVFALDIDEDGNVINQSHSYVKIDRWEGYDDDYYTLENQNGGYTNLVTDILTPFELTFVYKRPDCIANAPADMRYSLEPVLYYSGDGKTWSKFNNYSEKTLVDESRTRVTYDMVPATYKYVKYFRLDLYVKTPDGTVSDVKIPYSHYLYIAFGGEGVDLANAVRVNGTTYTNSSPVAHLKPSSPTVEFSYYLPEDLYNAGYRMAVVENGTTYYPDTGYGYQDYLYRGSTTGTAGQSKTLNVSFKLYHKDNKNSFTDAGSLSVTLEFDATPVTVFGVELQDGQYITSTSKAVKTGTPTSSQRVGYVWNNGGVLVIKNFRPTYTLEDTNFIYKKNQGDLYIELIGTNVVQITSDSSTYGIFCNNDLTVTGKGRLTYAVVDTDGEYATNSRGVYLVGGSMTLEGATLQLLTGKGIEVAGIGQKITVKALTALDDNNEIVTTQPHLGIYAVKECFTVFDDTLFDIQGGTFDVTAYDYGARVANVSAMQYKQVNYKNGSSTIIAGDTSGEWIYDINTSYTSSTVYEIDAKNITSLRLVNGVDCIGVGNVVLESGDYLINGTNEVQGTKPEKGGYAYNDGGTLVLHNFAYEGEGYITEMPSNPNGNMPEFTFRITLEGDNVITNTGKTVGKPWHEWNGAYGIVAQNDLVINGHGTLTVNSNGGILYTGDMTVEDGDIIINAAKNGIFARANPASDVTDTYLQNSFLTVNGGDVTIASSDIGINGYTTLRVPNGSLIINSTSKTIKAYSSSSWNVTFDLDTAKAITIYGGPSEASSVNIPYITDEELFNRFANVAYQYNEFVGDNGVLDIEMDYYKVSYTPWDVEYDGKNSSGLRVYIKFYDEDGYSLSASDSFIPGVNYSVSVNVDYPNGIDRNYIYSKINLKVQTANGYKEYTIDAGEFDSYDYSTVTERYQIDPPSGNPIEALEFDLASYEIGATVGELDVDVVDSTSVYGDPSLSLYNDVGGIASPDVLDSSYVICGGTPYWAVVNVELWLGHYVPAGIAAANFKMNGISAALVETKWKYNGWVDKDQQIVTLYFPLSAIKAQSASVLGTVSGVEDTDRVKIELYSEGMPEPSYGFSVYGNDSYDISDVEAGEYTVIATAEGYYEYSANITVSGENVIHDIAMEKIPSEYTLSGSVAGVESGDTVTVQLFEQGLSEPSYEAVVTGNDSFSINRVFEGSYTVKAFAEGYKEYTSIFLVNGTTTLDIVMEKKANDYTVGGNVSGVGAGTNVYACIFEEGMTEPAYAVVLAGGGSFKFDNIIPGTYTLKINAEGYKNYSSTFTVTSSDVTKNVTLILESATTLYGDANNDGKVNTKDVLLIRKYLGGLATDDEINLEAADVDHDGKITPKDVLKIRKYLGGIITELN